MPPVQGVFGLLDLVSGGITKNLFDVQAGLFTYLIILLFKALFGTAVAMATVNFLIPFSATFFVWLGISAVLRRKIIKLEKDSGVSDGLASIEKNRKMSKGFKIALMALLIPFGILVLIGIIANL